MSWWNNAGIGNLASAALKTAQSRIDKVLDIKAEDGEESPPPVKTSVTEPTPISPNITSDASKSDDSEFWNTWLAADKLASSISTRAKVKGPSPTLERPKTPEVQTKGSFASDFFSSTISSSLSKVQQLKKVGGSALLKTKHELFDRAPSVDEASDTNRTVANSENISDGLNSDSHYVPEKLSDGLENQKSNSAEIKQEQLLIDESRKPITEPLQIDVPLASPHEPMAGAGLLATENTINMERETANSQRNDSNVVEVRENRLSALDDVDEDLLEDPDASQSGWGDASLSILVSSTSSVSLDVNQSESEADITINEDNVEVREECIAIYDNKESDQNSEPNSSEDKILEKEDTTFIVGLSTDTNPESVMALSGNAWNIPELSESTLNDLVKDDEQTADNASKILAAYKNVISEASVVEPVTRTVDMVNNAVLIDSSVSVSQMDRTEVLEPPIKSMESPDSLEEQVNDEPTDSAAAYSGLVKNISVLQEEPTEQEGIESLEMKIDSSQTQRESFEMPQEKSEITSESHQMTASDMTTESCEILLESSELPTDSSGVLAESSEITRESDMSDSNEVLTSSGMTTESSDIPLENEAGNADDAAMSVAVQQEDLEFSMAPVVEDSYMQSSFDNPDDLSSSNRTLTDDFEHPRLSSVSSQATLEASADDDQLGECTNEKDNMSSEIIKEEMDNSPNDQCVHSGESRENLLSSTHSSFVKNMLEEAMVESMKDTDSHTDSHSHSSSDMVRIESGPTSGHTSADEIETNTSSDIEIISHISTPTPNGENRMFDLSPLRHALSRTMRRNSPPGHKRSDSGSSGQSRNGDDVILPDGTRMEVDAKLPGSRSAKREQKKLEEASYSSAFESDKLLKPSESKTIPLQPIEENLENLNNMTSTPSQFGSVIKTSEMCTSADQLLSPVEKLTLYEKKLAETAEILDAREKKVMELSRENVDLMETNNILRQQLQQSEEAREEEMTDLNTLTEEFTKRMSEAEKKIQSVIKEKDALRRKLLETESELARRANDKATERIMKEKDEQITELLEEGEKLSKQQLQSNNIIKKLRTKERENESLLKSQKVKIESQTAEIEKLITVLDNKVDVEKKQSEAINQLNNAVLVQEVEINRLKSDLEDSTEKTRSMQVILDNTYKELSEMHKANAVRRSESHEQALNAEIQAREQLQQQLERARQQMKNEQENLITQIEDLQLCIGRMEKDHGRREDILRQEISDLQQRLQEAEERNQDLTQSVTQATRPLLRQIENLQSTASYQVSSYEKVEKNLTDRLSELQTQLALSQEKERNAVERLIEFEAKLFTLETQVSTLRQDKSKLQAALEMEKAKLEILEDSRNNESAQLAAHKMSYDKEMSEIRKEKMMIENQLEMEKMRTDSEKKKVTMLHEQLREKEMQWAQARKLTASPTPSFSRESSFTVDSPMSLSQHEEAMEKTLLLVAANGNKTSLYESLKQVGATSVLENLQAQVKMRDGEITQLQSEIQELERTRESMAKALVSLTNSNELLEDQLKEFPVIQQKYKDLDQRYNALLMMYGEKVEEAEELRLDLQDVKDLYKTQINELLKTH